MGPLADPWRADGVGRRPDHMRRRERGGADQASFTALLSSVIIARPSPKSIIVLSR